MSAQEAHAPLSSAHYLIDHNEYFGVEIQMRRTEYRLLGYSAMAGQIELVAAATTTHQRKNKILFAPISFSLAEENLIFLKFIRT